MADLPEYVLEREFDAPREMVWRAWTEAELIPKWYGPGVTSIVHSIDLRPGGTWLHEMQWGDNSHYQKAEYVEVSEPARLVWLHSNCDADGTIIANPMMPDWPRVLLTTVTFEEADGKTALRLTWVPHEANQAEIDCFAGAMAGMGKGWGAGMDLLEKLLAEMASG